MFTLSSTRTWVPLLTDDRTNYPHSYYYDSPFYKIYFPKPPSITTDWTQVSYFGTSICPTPSPGCPYKNHNFWFQPFNIKQEECKTLRTPEDYDVGWYPTIPSCNRAYNFSTHPSKVACLSPLARMTLATTYEGTEHSHTHLGKPYFNITMNVCLQPTDRTYFLCGSNAYLCLPANWMGTCTLTYIIPNLTLVNDTISLPLYSQPHKQRQATLTIISVLVSHWDRNRLSWTFKLHFHCPTVLS